MDTGGFWKIFVVELAAFREIGIINKHFIEAVLKYIFNDNNMKQKNLKKTTGRRRKIQIWFYRTYHEIQYLARPSSLHQIFLLRPLE
jgi:hypothetical protein